MPDVTSDKLRDIAVRVVEGFLNDKVPLSQGLAKEAAAHDLNSEQVKRAVEASNTIAYLKVLSMADDRTVEFPLCKYAEVMHAVAVPELQSVEKQATAVTGGTDSEGGELDKQASCHEEGWDGVTDRERTLAFIKEAGNNKAMLAALMERGEVLGQDMVKKAKKISTDPKCLDKMACALSDDEFKPLSVLAFGEAKEKRDFGSMATAMFKEAELKEIKDLATMYKEARAIVSEVAQRAELDKRASVIQSELQKQAFAGFVMRGVKSALSGAASKIGYGLGKAVAAPFTGAAAAVGRVAHSAVGTPINAAQKAVSEKLGLKTPKVPIKKGWGGAAVAAAAPVAMDASMYTPGQTETGRSKNVWDALN